MNTLRLISGLLFLSLMLPSCGHGAPKSGEHQLEVPQKCDSTGTAYFKNSQYFYYVTYPEDIRMALKDSDGNPVSSFSNLKELLEKEGKELLFATNGGMFGDYTDLNPVGAYVENGKKIHRVVKTARNASGNFSMPFGQEYINGIFLIDSTGRASIIKSSDYPASGLCYATQSGPLMLYSGEINGKFNESSVNVRTRNGIGVMPDGRVVMVLANNINFYDLASIFKKQFGCDFAMYLDGAISGSYVSSGVSTPNEGPFGVIIYVAR